MYTIIVYYVYVPYQRCEIEPNPEPKATACKHTYAWVINIENAILRIVKYYRAIFLSLSWMKIMH